MSGKEWLRLGLVAGMTSAWWAHAMWPDVFIRGELQANPITLTLAVICSVGLLVMAVIGIWETWDNPQ